MPRILCQHCHRPQLSCICQFVTKVKNTILVVVLQHPNEVKQSKGTLTLLANSLQNCVVIVDEDFTHNQALNDVLAKYQQNTLLLYPQDDAQTIESMKKTMNNNGEKYCLILIDATWKKAYRMYMLSKNLHSITKLQLPTGYRSLYKIRKTTVTNGLSTLEACCYALSDLEKEPEKYQKLLSNFVGFNEFLLSFRKTKAQ
ncbi:MAG: hypothetical protein COB35_01445 [Gammaproteobacteria bacterium]|nr:MAG: hypothetical protein COB35_01445 [Gammaproteobacteria bacterium]